MKNQIPSSFYYKTRIDILQEDNEIERLRLLWQSGFYSDGEFVKVSEEKFKDHGESWAVGQIQYRDYETQLEATAVKRRAEAVGAKLLEPLGAKALSPFVKK